MKITPEMLRDAGACADGLDIFTTEWPDGAEVTLANCLRAVALGLNIDCAADKLFQPRSRLAYHRQRAQFWAEYERQCATLQVEYERQRAQFWAEYERQRAPLREECERQCAAFWEEYARQCATVFFAIASEL